MESKFSLSIDDLTEEQLGKVVLDFLTELGLVGEFRVWVEKWKSIHRQ